MNTKIVLNEFIIMIIFCAIFISLVSLGISSVQNQVEQTINIRDSVDESQNTFVVTDDNINNVGWRLEVTAVPVCDTCK